MPNPTCVILCSVRKDLDVNSPSLQMLRGQFKKLASIPRGTNGTYPVVDYDDMSVDGGNGGGGDASGPLIFVAGRDGLGAWDFRFHADGCASANTPAGRDCRYPSAARIELCIPMPSVDSARVALSNGKRLNYLSDVFENVLIVPFSDATDASIQANNPIDGRVLTNIQDELVFERTR